MKRRQGFVSNSSSSSFILGVNKDVNNEDIRIEISIAECVDKRLSTVEQVRGHFQDEYGGLDMSWDEFLAEEGEYIAKRYDECIECIENGQDVIFGSGSNEGDTAGELAIYYGALNDLDMDDVTVIDAGEC